MKNLFFLLAFVGLVFTSTAQMLEAPDFDVGIELTESLEMPPLPGLEVVVIDQVEARFVPDVIKQSTVLSNTKALSSFDWNQNPYEADVLVDTGPNWQRTIQVNNYITISPNVLYGSSGGPSDRR